MSSLEAQVQTFGDEGTASIGNVLLDLGAALLLDLWPMCAQLFFHNLRTKLPLPSCPYRPIQDAVALRVRSTHWVHRLPLQELTDTREAPIRRRLIQPISLVVDPLPCGLVALAKHARRRCLGCRGRCGCRTLSLISRGSDVVVARGTGEDARRPRHGSRRRNMCPLPLHHVSPSFAPIPPSPRRCSLANRIDSLGPPQRPPRVDGHSGGTRPTPPHTTN